MFRMPVLAIVLLGSGVGIVFGQTCPGASSPTDYCSMAYVIDGSVGHHIVYMDVSTATNVTGETQVYTSAGHTVWFSVTPEVSAQMIITTCHPFTRYDTVMEVYSGGESNCEFMTLVAWNDDTVLPECVNGCSSYDSSVTIDATAGTRYRFVVGSYNNNQAGCDLCLGVRVTIGEPCGEPPAAGGCGDAYELPGSAGLHEATMDVQSAWGHYIWETNPLCSGVTEISHTVWFVVTPEVSGTLTFSTCHPNTTYDTVLFAFQGDCETYEYLECNDDYVTAGCYNGCWYGSQVEIPVQAGQPYWFWIGAYADNPGECQLCLGISMNIEDACATETTPPLAELTSPPDLGTACTCGGFVSITGTANDPDGTFHAYGLDYRPAGGGAWQNITVSTNPVIGGELALWDASGLAQGYYLLKLSVANACDMVSTDEIVLYLDTQFDNVTVRYPPPPSPQWPVVRDKVCVEGTVFESWCWHPATTDAEYVVLYRAIGSGYWQPVDPAQPAYSSTVVNDPFAEWDTIVYMIPDGQYQLMVSAYTDCGFYDMEIRSVIVDNTPPTAQIINPGPCSVLDGFVSINGTAYDANLDSWVLEYTGDGQSGWIPLATGSQNVVNNTLHQWNVSTLEPCAYTLRLRVYDRALSGCGTPGLQWREYLVSVEIGGEECIGDLDGDMDVDLSDLAALLSHYGEFCD